VMNGFPRVDPFLMLHPRKKLALKQIGSRC
jgi:hypothetical protein